MEKYQKVDAKNFNFQSFYNEINDNQGNQYFYLLCADAKKFLQKIIKSVTPIAAAGGMVENKKGEYLFIFRNKKWDLPKGKIEKGEGKKEGAMREVEEECGIAISEMGKRICKTYHTYMLKGELVLKTTYWYKMSYAGNEKLKPQLEEGITKVRWFKRGQIDTIVKNTYPSIMDVLKKMDMLIDTVMPL